MALRDDEEFVICTLASAVSGTWRQGEDPPDAYLDVGTETVAVEISTLTQYVDDHSGTPIPRFSQDAAALRLCEELNKELSGRIPHGHTVHLVLESPIEKVRRFKPKLAGRIIDLVNRTEQSHGEIDEEIFGNHVKIQHDVSGREWGKKVVGLVINRKSSADISMNAQFILDHRIAAKDEKCRSLHLKSLLWLALLNDYWLASVSTYQRAMAMSKTPHRFDKILLVSGDGTVATLYSKHAA